MWVVGLSFLLVVADQAAKFRICRAFYPGESVAVIPGFFHLTYVRNTGAAWGMLSGSNGWLAALSVVLLALLVVFRRKVLTESRMHRLALGCLAGGIVGNLVDRVRLAYVVDFLDFFWRGWHFPAFNVADASICIGVGLYLLTSARRPAAPAGADGAPSP